MIVVSDIPVSFLAGLFSFISPFVFPLIPAYLSYIGGISYRELRETGVSKFSLFLKTLTFTAGFSLVFIFSGLFYKGISTIFSRISPLLFIIPGAVIIIFGLHFIFDFLKVLNIEKNISIKNIPSGYPGALILGIAFGAGWTPCISPLLRSILIRASIKETVSGGIILLIFYSTGLGVPFLLAGLFLSIFSKNMKKMNPYLGRIKKISGCFLIFLGILIISGSPGYMNEVLMRTAVGLENWRQKQPYGPIFLFSVLFFVPALLILIFYIRKLFIQKEPGVYPFRIFFFILFFVISLLTLIRVIDMVKLIFYWLNFSGI